MSYRNYVFPSALLIFLLASFYPTMQLPGAGEVSTFIGPRLWPFTLWVILVVLVITLFSITRSREKRENANNEERFNQGSPCNKRGANVSILSAHEISHALARSKHWVILVLAVLYTVLMQLVGFLIATGVFSLVCTMVLGTRHKGAILATVLIAMGLIQGVFVTLLNIPLP
ncbi:tripartite tricarboxylate transporter TctB family protein [Aidingimonas halophila]|uniref:Tripartite tricarboxylate transporter TctB family protein n=1 Tax=Aidingimonas halophila TaxID=574349 RepID=A0A1H2RPH1_9GAMM|nr:Tripartite tricarboxylate transporter TctB family protein [Aidingimonas halophila]